MTNFEAYAKGVFAELLPWQTRMLESFARCGGVVLIPHIRGAGLFFDALCAEYDKFTWKGARQ